MTANARPRTSGRRTWVDEQSLFWYRLAQRIFALLFRFWGGGLRSSGVEHVPRDGAAFLIANHTSGIDPFVVGLPVQQRILRGPGKIELFKNPIVSYLMRKIGIFPIRRDVADTAAVRTMLELYRSGQIVIVFPEGGRSFSGEMKQFDPGFTRLALKMKARLVPAGIAGAREFVPVHSLIPRRGVTVAIAYGEPFDLSAFYDRRITDELLTEATAAMQKQVAQMIEKAVQLRADSSE